MTLTNTNHDIVHALSVRLDARWHDASYQDEVTCLGCRHVFDRLRQLDDEAIGLLSGELADHVRAGKFAPGALERV